MSKFSWCVLVLGWLAMQSQADAKFISWEKMLTVAKHKVVPVAMAALFIGNASLAARKLQLEFRYDMQEVAEERALRDEDIELAWERTRNNPPPHHDAVFYLLLDGFDVGWRVMHIEYIGNSKRDEPLFVGPRPYLLSGIDKNGKPKFVLNWAQPSLVGNRGLIKQNVEIEEITHFSHPYDKAYDQTLITIKDVDLSEYKPISIAAHPETGTELTMLSYRVRAEDLLKFFNYPLERRNCQALAFDAEDLMVVHSCHIPHTGAVLASPIFAEDKLVALYYGVTKNEDAYGSVLLPELRAYMAKTLDVTPQSKMTSMWGEIKER